MDVEHCVSKYLLEISSRLREEGNEPCAAQIESCILSLRRAHWYEMSVGLLEALKNPSVLKSPYEFHSNVLVPIRSDLSPAIYVQFVYFICVLSGEYDSQKALAVIEEASHIVREDAQSSFALVCIRALLLLRECTEEEAMCAAVGSDSFLARRLLDDVDECLKRLQVHEIDPLLVGLQCLARGRDYELRRMYSAFYNNAFDLVKHAEKAEMPLTEAELGALAYKTAIAALLSEETYNFGRFLNFPVFTSLLNRSHSWLLQLAEVCNQGSISGFEEFWTRYEKPIREIPELFSAASALRRKVQVMALLHLVFCATFNERVFRFSTIAARCGVDEKGAELLVLEALAQGVIRGRIDGLLKTVHIGWVEPRVLNLKEVRALSEHVSAWKVTVEDLAEKMRCKTSKILN